jgi:hypothetical protein
LAQPSRKEKESESTGIDASRSGKDLPAKESPEMLIQETDVRELVTPDMLLDGNV